MSEQLVLDHLGVARAIANRYRNRGVDSADLQQVAYLGLVKAAQNYQPESGNEFLSYAVPTIAGEVKRYFRDRAWAIRPPRRLQELHSDIVKCKDELRQTLGRSPRPAELAKHLGVDEEQVIEALSMDGCFSPASLDLPVGATDTGTLGGLIEADDHEFDRAEARLLLEDALERLDQRERRVVQLRFFKGWTQAQIGREIGVTQVQVSRILGKILGELRVSIGAQV